MGDEGKENAFYDDGSPVEPDGNVGQVCQVRSHTLHAVGGDAGAIHISLGTHKFARTPINREQEKARARGTRDVSRFAVSYSQRRCGLVWESRWNLSPGGAGVVTKASGTHRETPRSPNRCFDRFVPRREYEWKHSAERERGPSTTVIIDRCDESHLGFIACGIILDEKKSKHYCAVAENFLLHSNGLLRVIEMN